MLARIVPILVLAAIGACSSSGSGNGDAGVNDGATNDDASESDGGCTTECQSGATCQNGTCVCSAPLVDCSGVCVDVESDPANCGGCGLTCMFTCVTGGCKH